MAPNSNECYIANVDGEVIRSRSVARFVEVSRWDAKAVENIKGVPGKTVTFGQPHAGAEPIEETLEPHVHADQEERAAVNVEQEPNDRNAEDVRITMCDLRLYGFHPGVCLRCENLRRGIHDKRRHSDECRWRIYQAFRDAKDPKFQKVKHLLDEDLPQNSAPADVGHA